MERVLCHICGTARPIWLKNKLSLSFLKFLKNCSKIVLPLCFTCFSHTFKSFFIPILKIISLHTFPPYWRGSGKVILFINWARVYLMVLNAKLPCTFLFEEQQKTEKLMFIYQVHLWFWYVKNVYAFTYTKFNALFLCRVLYHS